MPHAALKLVPGTDTQETPALNQNAGVSQTNLIRFFPDRNGLGLVQKLGGWTLFPPGRQDGIVRSLCAWEDLNNNAWLGVGMQTIAATNPPRAELSAITGGVAQDITPYSGTSNIPPNVQTFAGSSIVNITDSTFSINPNFDSTVYIATQISVGGLVLFGSYALIGQISNTTFTIQATDILGNPTPATSSSTTAVVPQFATVSGKNRVTVVLPNHGYVVNSLQQSTFPVLVPSAIGGITFFGNYLVQTIIDANTFTIQTTQTAAASSTAYINYGNARLIYSLGLAKGAPIDASDWTLDNFGSVLLACPTPGASQFTQTPYQPIYAWVPGSSYTEVIPNAPPVNDGFFVAMPQRQVVAWGSTVTGIQDPLLIRWCDVNNLNVWVATATNQAGSFRLTRGSKIVSGIQGPQQGFIFTDIDVWAMQYIGAPNVYGFTLIGSGCGLLSRKAVAVVDGEVFWMSYTQFYTIGSQGAQIVPCPVWDVIFQNLDQNNLSKIRVAVNSRFNEIMWFYPSLSGGGEVDSYVKFNIELAQWDYGRMARSAWVDQSVLGPPIGADPVSQNLYQHETSNDAAGTPMLPYFQTGYMAIAEGDQKTFIDWVWPDMKWGQYSAAQTATVQITFYVADYPGDTPKVYGPYSVTQATEYFYTRFRGRLVAVRIASSDLGSFWRIGNIRYRYAQDGKI